MFRKLLVAAALTVSSLSASATDLSTDQFWFRYAKSSVVKSGEELPPEQEQNVLAHYVAGLNTPFEQALPLKASWNITGWEVVTASQLPAGITFNPATSIFSGTPTTLVTGTKVELAGYDRSGNQVRSATAIFDVYGMTKTKVQVNFYAHTGKQSFFSLPMPEGVVVDKWVDVSGNPPGLTFNQRNIEGKPTKEGIYPIFVQGLDFLGNAVITFLGQLVVEDGPNFPVMADYLLGIPPFNYSVSINYPVPSILRPVDPAKKVRYVFELQDDSVWPGTVRPGGTVNTPTLSGLVFNPYEVATVRLKAIDSDKTEGYSNWFKVGTLGPTPICTLEGSTIKLPPSFVDVEYNYQIPPRNAVGKTTFELTAGELPEGLKLTEDGRFAGTAKSISKHDGIMVKMTLTNNGIEDTTSCGPYSISAFMQPVSLVAKSTPEDGHIRIGGGFSARVTAGGGLLDPKTISLVDPSKLPEGLIYNQADNSIAGVPAKAGTHNIVFALNNGDGQVIQTPVFLQVHGHVAVDDVPSVIEAQKYQVPEPVFSFGYDASTFMPGELKFELIGSEKLPDGLQFDPLTLQITGSPKVSGSFGPFQFKGTDGAAESDITQPFMLEVADREEMKKGAVVPANFYANVESEGVKPFSVVQPWGATELKLSYSLVGPDLPEGLKFDPIHGIISGKTDKKVTIDGYTITVTDTEDYTVTSDAFSLTVSDPPPIPDVRLSPLAVNVTSSKFPSTLALPSPNLSAVERFIIGGLSSVKFTGMEPTVAGLSLSENGVITGAPTELFVGEVALLYKDRDGHPGRVLLPLKVIPVPSVSMNSSQFSLPRLSQAKDMAATPNDGFVGGISWSIAPGAGELPAGLQIDGGKILGSTNVQPGTYPGIVVRATDTATRFYADTSPFSIDVGAQVPLQTVVPAEEITYYLNVASKEVMEVSPAWLKVSHEGSADGTVTYEMVSNLFPLLLNSNTGMLTGAFSDFSSWTASFSAKDAKGNKAPAKSVKLTTLPHGPILVSPTMQSRKVRINEAFETDALAATNVADKVIFELMTPYPGVTVNSSSGVATGSFAEAGVYDVGVRANELKFARTSSNAITTVMVVPKVSINPPASGGSGAGTGTGKQFSKIEPITLPAASNAMGDMTYFLTVDNLSDFPGTLINLFTDEKTGRRTWQKYTIDGSLVEYQGPDQLPIDAVVFDTANRTLTGVPSKAGVFDKIKYTAADSHDFKPGQAGHNPASYQTVPFTLVIEEAAPLVLTMNETSHLLHQFTELATMISAKVDGAAYGAPLSWVKLSGTLPRGVAANNGVSFGMTGYAQEKGEFTNIVFRGTDAAGRVVQTPPFTISVSDRQVFGLIATANPKGMLVFEGDANNIVKATNPAYGVSPTFTVTGVDKLPPGVTHEIKADGVYLTGKSDIIGRYSGFTVKAVDRENASATLALTFDVISSSDPINLVVSDITLKVGQTLSMQAPHASTPLSTSNTYGDLIFKAPGLAAIGFSIDEKTGALGGLAQSVGEHLIHFSVTDDTNRVSGHDVRIRVIPNLRLIARSYSQTTQGETLTVPVSTDYAIGKVTYRKGKGTWPIGISVNTGTGVVSGTPRDDAKLYSGLTVIGVDQSGDERESNAFDIELEPVEAKPILDDFIGKQIFTVGTEQSLAVVTKEDVTKQPWTYGGLKYSINRQLPAGLDFDTLTGTIQGTPSEPGIIRDLVITVTSSIGDTASTKPFWFGVQPNKPIVAKTGQKLQYKGRVGTAFASDAPLFDNAMGYLTYSARAGSYTRAPVNTNTGVVSFTPSEAVTSAPILIQIEDEFGRKGQIDLSLNVGMKLVLNVNSGSFPLGGIAVDFEMLKEVKNNIGTVTFKVTDVPTGWQLDAAQKTKLKGSFKATDGYVLGQTVYVTITATDNDDNSSVSAVVPMAVAENKCKPPTVASTDPKARRYFGAGWISNVKGQSGWAGKLDNAVVADVSYFDMNGNCLKPVSMFSYFAQNATSTAWDENDNTTFTDSLGSGLYADFGTTARVGYMVITMTGTVNDVKSLGFCRSNVAGWGTNGYHMDCTNEVPRYSYGATVVGTTPSFSAKQKVTVTVPIDW